MKCSIRICIAGKGYLWHTACHYIDTVAIFSYQHLCRHVQGDPFYEQSVYMKVRVVDMRPVPGRFCIGMIPGREEGSLRGHAFHFPAGSYTLSKHHCLYGMDFLTRDNLYAAFIHWCGVVDAMAIVVGWLTYNRASGLFVSYLTMLLATVYFSSLAFYVMEHGPNL